MTAAGILTGRRVLVTGGARGIGLATARAAQAQGARVAIADIDADVCRAAAADMPGAVALQMDVSDPQSVRDAAQAVMQAFGGLDGLVNNAAIVDASDTASVAPDRIDRIMAISGTSVLHVTQAMLPMLECSAQAAVVNTLSTQAFYAQPHAIAYAAAKGAALAITRNMAIDLAPKGIRVNAVAPGFIRTRMAILANGEHEHDQGVFSEFYVGLRKIPLGRGGTPEECAGAFLYLLSDLSSYVTGQVIVVDGGLTATY